MSDRSIPGRSRALDAAIRLAIEAAGDDDGSGWSLYRSPDVEVGEVERETEGDVSTRTARRATKDAAALGWLTDETRGFDVGPKARETADSAEKITVCEECSAVVAGLTSHCPDCGSECIRQEVPAEPDPV